MSGVKTVTVPAADAGMRLDRWFKRGYPGLSHGRLEKLLRTGQIRLDGKRVKANTRLDAGQSLRIPPLDRQQTAKKQPARTRVSADDLEALRACVIHKDAAVLAINKPPGLAVQGGSGTRHHLDAMLDGLRFDAAERPRLVHRLDKDTSGVLLLARHAKAAAALTRAFRDKTARKVYWALCAGAPALDEGTVDAPLGKRSGQGGERVQVDPDAGKTAVTDYRVIDRAGDRVCWLALQPWTGRTHQLRVHCAAIGVPILGDGKYGGRAAFPEGLEVPRKLHLHAHALDLPHPAGGRLQVEAVPAAHFLDAMERFGFLTSDYAISFT